MKRSTFVLSLIIAIIVSMGLGVVLAHFILKDNYTSPPVNVGSSLLKGDSQTTEEKSPMSLLSQAKTNSLLTKNTDLVRISDDLEKYTLISKLTNTEQNLIITTGKSIISKFNYCMEYYGKSECGDYNSEELASTLSKAKKGLDTILNFNILPTLNEESKILPLFQYNKEGFVLGLTSDISNLLPKEFAGAKAYMSMMGQELGGWEVRIIGKEGDTYYTAYADITACDNPKTGSLTCDLQIISKNNVQICNTAPTVLTKRGCYITAMIKETTVGSTAKLVLRDMIQNIFNISSMPE